MKRRVAAIIIKNKKILLTRDKGSDLFSLPGGIIEPQEDPEDALSREIEEELDVKISIDRKYNDYKYLNTKFNLIQTDINYLVSLRAVPQASSEIAEIRWFNKKEVESNKTAILFTFLETIFPQLVKDNLL